MEMERDQDLRTACRFLGARLNSSKVQVWHHVFSDQCYLESLQKYGGF